jgi:aspartate ammonia-lyase
MNANEVIANLALEHLGHKRGEYKYLRPNEHVNMSQSTNDYSRRGNRPPRFLRQRSRFHVP